MVLEEQRCNPRELGTDTESEPFKGEAETPKSPYTVGPPTCRVEESEGCGTIARMAMRVPPTMSLGLFSSIAEVTFMFDLTFCRRFRSSYDSSQSPTFPVRKRYRVTSELILDTDSVKDEEIEESSDYDSVSEDVEDEGPTTEDEDPAAGDEGLATGDEGPGMGVESRGLDDESRGLDDEVIVHGALRCRELVLEGDHVYSAFEVGRGFGSAPEPERPNRVSSSRQPTLTTWTDPEDGIVYIDIPTYPPLVPPAQTPPSPEWSSGSLPIFPSPSIVPSPMISLTVPSPIASPATAEAKGFLTELEPRSLEYEQERTAVTFGALWRPVLALEARAGRVDTRITDMSRVGYDYHILVHNILLQLAALQRELQEMRDRVTVLEQERDHRER
nr:hypothetical protein [Tanacetum cinerariifolium]